MSFVIAHPELLSEAAGELQAAGSAVQAQSTMTAGPTTTVAPPAADVVSALTAAKFNAHGALFQTVAAQAVTVQQMFVATLSGNAASYATAEAVNALAVS